MLLTYWFSELVAVMLLDVVVTTVYNHLVFNVFLKPIFVLFSEVGSCYVVRAGFLLAGLKSMDAAILFLSKALDVNAKELSLLA